RSAEFTTEKIEAMEVAYDGATRKAYQELVEQERQAKSAAKAAEQQELAQMADQSGLSLLVAVATKGQGRVNEHFGHVSEFQIYEVSSAGSKFVGHRRVDQYCQGGYGEEDALETVIRAIN
ncbi:NifB/NifX family molybdenum-iron cluster-binding protein, partial [Herbaspirillum sp. B65]